MRNLSFGVNEYFHIYNRGVDKRDVFMSSGDLKRFMALLFVSNRSKLQLSRLSRDNKQKYFQYLENIKEVEEWVDIVAYCLMPNHFHLVVREKVEGGVSSFVHKLTTSYSKNFNKKYERTGALFQGKFKAEHINNDAYFNYIFCYVNLNPLSLFDPRWKKTGVSDKEGAKEFLMNYNYSSYLDCIGVDRGEKIILNRDEMPDFLQDFDNFQGFVDGWFKNKGACEIVAN